MLIFPSDSRNVNGSGDTRAAHLSDLAHWPLRGDMSRARYSFQLATAWQQQPGTYYPIAIQHTPSLFGKGGGWDETLCLEMGRAILTVLCETDIDRMWR